MNRQKGWNFRQRLTDAWAALRGTHVHYARRMYRHHRISFAQSGEDRQSEAKITEGSAPDNECSAEERGGHSIAAHGAHLGLACH
jgi:hypothetical protein